MRPRRSASGANLSYAEAVLSDDEMSVDELSMKAAPEPKRDATKRVKSKKRKGVVESSEDEFVISDVEVEDALEEDADELSSLDEGESTGDETNSAAAEDEDEIEDVLRVDEIAPRAKKPRKSASGKKGIGGSNAAVKNLAETLPPISSLPDIFKDLTSRVTRQLDPALKRLDGRSLRVGTMCSGTESPLLALGLISNALKDLTGEDLSIEHIFSCEIEPFKQAYIERNFAPPLLFRDVTELGEDQALTAYGGLADVPGEIDLLVAGTSCVDYSPLNRQKKTIDAGGESGRTFFGMLDYVIKHQPSIVVLENVSGAPWDEVVERFEEIGYDAAVLRLDTKHYYIPHTRTRGYLMAVPKKSGVDASDWQDVVKSLQRPASVPLEAFLLPTDDPRIQRARQDLAVEQQTKDGIRRAPTDWIKCESRHHRAREEEMLGNKRPLTAWQDGGGPPTLPDGSWNDWAVAQTERVLDLMDISVLRLAKKGTDVNYKSAVWNLSQNVDRTTGSVLLGICPCLTPNMIPYLASRGGPITGVEALALQGIPIDQLLLTRENQDQLADLAGNAMSSTVVGAAILASLVVAGKTIVKRSKVEAMEEDAPAAVPAASPDDQVEGKDKLDPAYFNAFDTVRGSLDDLMQQSVQAARRCVCEGRNGLAASQIWKCTSCGHSACSSCKARPEHNYVVDETPRISPAEFERLVKARVPLRFMLSGFDRAAFDKVIKDAKGSLAVDTKLADTIADIAVEALDGAEFFYLDIYRRTTWIVSFKSQKARLSLSIAGESIDWFLYIDCPADRAVNDPIRQLLEGPIAWLRCSPEKGILEGAWQHCGDTVPSWRADLGLVEYANESRSSKIEVKVASSTKPFLDRPIDGVYELQAKCGTACNSLYRRIEPQEGENLYFFLDPTRSGDAKEDSFVFATTCDRIEYGSSRPILAKTSPGWRSEQHEGDENVELVLPSICWDMHDARFSSCSDATPIWLTEKIARPANKLELSAGALACQSAQLLLSADVQPPASAEVRPWLRPTWTNIDVLHQGPEVFDALGWIVARSQSLAAVKDWQALALDVESQCVCEKCCPPAPAVQWMRKSSAKTNAIVAVENGIEAGRYEQALKARPSPLVVQTCLTDRVLSLRIALNVASLAHRAIGSLPPPDKSFHTTETEVQWRLRSGEDADLALGRTGVPPKFVLSSNRQDIEASQPPHFKKVKLRKEQLRSLTWMIHQEEDPEAWVVEEVAETVLPQLGWHAEARATRSVTVRGGILADEVGYGKTAISVGLISAQLDKTDLPEDTERVPVKATLIVVPGHLTSQWPSEIAKFTDGSLSVLTIKDVADLKRKTIEDFQEADIVLVSVTVFRSPLYWASFGDFSASSRGVKMDPNAGRYFRTCVDEAVEALPAQLERLSDEAQGASATFKAIDSARKERARIAQVVEEPPRRLKGRAYAFAQEQAKKLKAKITEAKPVKAKAEKAEAKSEEDPWQLKSSSVRHDWKQMKAPPLALFAFSRLIIDEFTYLDAVQLAAVRAIRASSRWILSGTPPMKDFYQIKTIAALLHVHLGIDDETEGRGREIKARSKERTSAEEFHSFRDVRTAGWHRRRDGVAQKFLDLFARQNWAEIDEIPYEEEIVSVELPAAEMAIYRELEHHLLALDANLTKLARVDKKKQGDREVRLLAALGESKTPEEALLKRCSHFSLDMDQETAALESAPHVCDQIVRRRQTQLEQCKEDLLQLIVTCAHMHRVLVRDGFFNEASGSRKADDRPFQMWLNNIFAASVGDDDAAAALRELAARAGCADAKVGQRPEGAPKPANLEEFNKPRESKVSQEEYRQAKVWLLRENCHRLRQLQKELIGRYRSQRYFECVRNVQCGKVDDVDNLAILSCCGHQGPIEEIRYAAARQECVVASCRAPVRSTNVVIASTLGRETESGHFGVKLETLVDIIDTVPKDDRILVFVQFDDLFDKVKEALEAYDIPTVCLTGTAKNKGATLERFQDPRTKNQRVLILRVTDSSASGANLTVANWAFFVSPLLADTLQQYTSFETQAIGRIRRYGQERPVKIVRLLTASTIDVDIYENRTGDKVAELVEAARATSTYPEGYPKKTRTPNMDKKTSVSVAEPVKTGAASKSKTTGAAKGKKKAQAESDDDEEMSAISTESEEEESVVEKKTKKKAAPAPSKAKTKKATPTKRAKKPEAAESSTTQSRALVIEDSSDDEDQVEMMLLSSPASKDKGKATRSLSPAKRKRVIAIESSGEDSEQEAAPAPRRFPVIEIRVEPPARKKAKNYDSDSASTKNSAKESVLGESETDTALTTPMVEKDMSF